ncbi:DNA-directed RNA polymerases II, IV and V subunit 8B-like [Salvia splendens]|nr:DNA-directed RNA polymerases II, IV and V subunit 8B-like [Salvia splendens]XP_042026243.1 DNA-directed RNA polymerases II, IV and V subunit 8B-like [Salvia splendens]XP_042026244.1 DNA-directed RNA polymerases II, IV and V subunit 8B-like [Salvia splendens]
MADLYFDEVIDVVKTDSQVVYDKVSRINARSEENDFFVELDVHSELYPMLPNEKHRMLISNSLIINGSGESKSLTDKFEYVMHGLLYKMADAKSEGDADVKVEVYISFGGLQLMLRGDPLKMHKFKVDQKLFLLLRKN